VEEQIPLNDESASHFAQRGKNAEAFLIKPLMKPIAQA
jgi:hypothetical protein